MDKIGLKMQDVFTLKSDVVELVLIFLSKLLKNLILSVYNL